MRRTVITGAAALVLGLALATTGHAASLRSFKGPLVMNQRTDVSVESAGIRVLSYRFNRDTRGVSSALKFGGGGPTILFSVKNEGTVARDFAIAVALFGESGALLGVGTEGNAGKLDPGEEKEVKVVFRDVNQNVAGAAALQVSLEIRL